VDEDAQRLDIFKLAVEMADRVSARRAAANTFFVTLNGTLAAVVGLAGWSSEPSSSFGLVVTAAAGVTLSLTWLLLLRYYRRLSKAKWDVINDLETRLPEQPFTDEWTALKPKDKSEDVTRRGLKDRVWKRKHRDASVVEQVVPWIFVGLYAALAVGLMLR
jgi:hypothetical protein